MKKNLILGSQSPRRKEILSYFSLPFTQANPPFEESSVKFAGKPSEYCCEIAIGKANALAKTYPDSIILTADTIVFCDGKIYGKPVDEADAFKSLSELVGRWHTVYTGVCIRNGKEEFHQAEATQVLFNDLNPDQIRNYLAHQQWADKAGGYAIQMAGGLIVKRIDGCYYNVMGLPINTVHDLLQKVKIDLWNYL